MIDFNRPFLTGIELTYIKEAVESGDISGEGQFPQRCAAFLQQRLGSPKAVLLTPSCTAALEMSALLVDACAGDEVIVPSFTFVTSASAFALRGARPVFVDIEPHTLNIDPAAVEAAISQRTKAILIVHYGGVACQMDALTHIAGTRNVALIEDAAHALGASYRGAQVGSFGRFAAFSFHETKNITCGEGGALIVNRCEDVKPAYTVQDKGTNRRQFQRGEAPFYSWVTLGSSYVMSGVLAAFLLAQLEKMEEINARRRALYQRYAKGLAPLRARGCVQFPDIGAPAESSAHIFFILLESQEVRDKLRKHLAARDIGAVFHYQPLHQSSYVRSRWREQPRLPVTERVAATLLRLPLYFSLKESEQDYVIESVAAFFGA